MRYLLWLPLGLALLALPMPIRAQADDDKDNAEADEQRLKNAYQSTDGPSIARFLSTRANGNVSDEKITELISKLEDKDANVRDKACGELVAIGAPAKKHLRLAARDVDSPDTAALAKRVLKVLDDDPANVTGAAVRLLSARRPEGTVEALLAYLPHADDDKVMDDIRTALAGVAYVKGKPAPAMLKALSDDHPLRRANAITALCAGGIAEPRETLRALLRDKSPSVRLRASLALAQAYDAKAVSTLVALLADLPNEQAQEVESFLSDLAGDQAPNVQLGTDDVSKQKCRDAWAKWWLDSEGPKLVEELKKRTLTEETTTTATALIDKLGDDSFEVRQTSETALRKMGPRIMSILRNSLKNPDLEIRNRCQKILSALEMDKSTPLSPVVPRLIALRKPKGAAEAILAYLPFADDDSMVDELQVALNTVAYPGGKANPAVVKALADKMPARRAAAAAALCNGPLSDYLAQIRKLLSDKEDTVKVRVALALASAREPEAVPALIKLVGETKDDLSSSAEEYLYKLARETPPKDLPEGDDNRKKRSEIWQKWYEDNKKTLVMVDRFSPTIRQRYLGYVLMVQNNNNQVVELDRNNKPRVTITGLNNPWDAHWVAKNRLLITEYQGMRVTERDTKGEIKWEKRLDFYPMQAERMKNGHTFIVGQNRIIQVDRSGKEVFRIDRNNYDVRTARRLPNGQIVMLTSYRQLIRMDRTGKVLKTAQLGNNIYINYQNEILDNGNAIIPTQWNNRLIEVNADGKEIWSVPSQNPMSAARLPNKNTLISTGNWPNKLMELDKSGKTVKEHNTNTYVFRIRVR